MNLQDSLTRAAGPDDAGFDHHDVERRVVRRRRTRRRARLAAGAAGLVVAFGLGALVADGGSGDPDGVRTGPVAGRDEELVAAATGTWDLRGLSIAVGVGDGVVLELRPDGTLAGTTPCGTFRADGWTVEAGRLVVDGLATDSHRCHPDPGRVESLLLDVLDDRPEVSRGVDDGVAEVAGPAEDWTTLQLTTPGAFVAFERDVQSRGLPAIEGEMPDGRAWTVTDSPEHGLCVTLGEVDVGCDDIGPAIAAGADPATPRGSTGTVGPYPEEEAAELLYAHLPADATGVALEFDDGRPADLAGVVVDADVGLWGLPVTPGDVPDIVRYTDDSVRQIGVFPVGG